MLSDLGAPRSMLTDRLSKLVDLGLMQRLTYQEAGSRARQAYTLTDAGRALGTMLIALSEWGEAHVLKGPAPVDFIDRETNARVRTALVDSKGRIVPLERVRIRLRKGGGG
jgi:DNA-binding HxlR family transcriptional regulator